MTTTSPSVSPKKMTDSISPSHRGGDDNTDSKEVSTTVTEDSEEDEDLPAEWVEAVETDPDLAEIPESEEVHGSGKLEQVEPRLPHQQAV